MLRICRIIALWAVPLGVLAQSPAPTLPDTTAPADIGEVEFRFASRGWTIVGTLTSPAGNSPPRAARPVVVIVAGSGPTDRNGNSGLGLRTNAYAYLAWGLSQQGYASLRYDKRGIGASAGPLSQDTLTYQHFAWDVTAATQALRQQGFGPIYLLGHSEGALLATLATTKGAPDGVILLAGQGRPLRQVLHDQLTAQVAAQHVARFDTAFAAYLAGQPVPEVLPPLKALLVPSLRTFMQSWDALNPPQVLAQVWQPKLIVQGGTDAQVVRQDYELLRAAAPTADTFFLPQMNHVLKVAASSRLFTQMAIYRDAKLPLHPDLVPGLVAWLNRQATEPARASKPKK